MARRKILLTLTNTRWYGHRYWYAFPYTLGLLYASWKENYDVRILDANIRNLSFGEVKEEIKNANPDIVCITCMSLEYDKAFKKIASLTKEVNYSILVIAGGIYPTLLPYKLISDVNIDYVIMGEGERRLKLLLDNIDRQEDLSKIDGIAYKNDNKAVIQPVLTYIQNLDSLKFPSYEDIDLKLYINQAARYSYYTYPRRFPYAFMISSRGCPFNCVYCSSKAINGPTIRYRSPESLINEIEELISNYGIKEIVFMDDNIYLDRKRLLCFLEFLINRKFDLQWKSVNAAVYALDEEILLKMWDAGCYQIAFAIESGTKKGLRLMNKPIKGFDKTRKLVAHAKRIGFETGGLFIIGIPGETWEDIRMTIKFAEELELDQVSLNIATPLPGTKLYHESKAKGLLPSNFSFDESEFYGFGTPIITTNEFIPEELKILRAFEWDRINFSTSEKEAKIAKMNGLTIEETKEWRKSTRRNLGIRVAFSD